MITPKHQEDKHKSDWRASFREAGPYLGLGMQFAGAMFFFTGIGFLLDRWLHTTPWLTVVGGIIGMIGVFVVLFRVSNELGKKNRREDRHDSHQP